MRLEGKRDKRKIDVVVCVA